MKYVIMGGLRAAKTLKFPGASWGCTRQDKMPAPGGGALGGGALGGGALGGGYISTAVSIQAALSNNEAWEHAEVRLPNNKCVAVLQPTQPNLVYAQFYHRLPSILVNGGICYQQKKLPLIFTVTIWGAKRKTAVAKLVHTSIYC